MKMFKVRYVQDGAWIDGSVVTQDRIGAYITDLAGMGVVGFQVDYVGLAEVVDAPT